MHSRSDSILLTGMTSSTVSKVDRERMARQKREKQEKLSKKNVLLPAVEPVLLEIDKEKQRTTLELIELVDNYTENQENHKELMRSLNMYRRSMDKLKTRIKNIMRVDIKETSNGGS